MSFSHTKLIQYILKLNYPIDEAGMCYGFAVMGMQAILANDLKTFEDRLAVMASIPPEDMVKRIDEVEKKRMTLIAQYKKNLKTALGVEDNIDDKLFYTLLQEQKDHKAEQSYYEKIHNINKDAELSSEEQSIIDIRAFLEGLTLYFSPQKFSDIFEEKSVPLQNAEFIFARGLSFNLIKKIGQKDEKTARFFIEESQVKKVGSFTGAYNLEDLTHYFRIMQEQKACNPPAVFLLSSANHAITVSYDAKQQNWILINTDNADKPVIKCRDYVEIAEEVLKSFSKNDITVFNTEVYCAASEFDQVQKNLDTCAQDETWKTIHKIQNKVQLTDSFNASMLHIDARTGDSKAVKALLECNADPNITMKNGSSSLYFAAQQGHTDLVNTLLESKANPALAMDNGLTPLYTAAKQGHIHIVKILLEHKVDLNAPTKDDWTLLHIAARFNQKNVVEVLLEHKVNPIVETRNGSSPLYIAAKFGHREIVEALLNYKVNPNIKTQNGGTPLHVAAAQDVNIVKLLLERKADPNAKMSNGSAPLHIAAQFGNKDIIEALLKHEETDPNATTQYGYTALHIAVQNGDKDIVKILLAHEKVKLAAVTTDGQAPLHIAVQKDNMDIVKILLEQQLKTEPEPKKKEAIQKIHALLMDSNNVDIMKIECDCFMQLNELIGKLLQIRDKNQEQLSDICSSAYKSYIDASSFNQRLEALELLNRSVVPLALSYQHSDRAFFKPQEENILLKIAGESNARIEALREKFQEMPYNF